MFTFLHMLSYDSVTKKLTGSDPMIIMYDYYATDIAISTIDNNVIHTTSIEGKADIKVYK